MIDWTDYAKELVVLAVDSVVLVAAIRWFRNTSKAVDALEVNPFFIITRLSQLQFKFYFGRALFFWSTGH